MSFDLVVFGEDWGGHPSSTQHLIRSMAERRRVIWVNSIGLRRPKLTLYDMRRLLTKFRNSLFDRSSKASFEKKDRGENPVVVSPLALPFPGNQIARRANRILLKFIIRKTMNKVGISSPVLWITLPTAVDMIGELGERAAAYYCCDDFGALEGVDHKPVMKLEKELGERADIVFVSSPVLGSKFQENKTRLLLHGVDIDLFTRSSPSPEDLPKDRPVAGFYGIIAEWFHVEIVAEAANLLPDWEFVLIGKVRTNTSKLEALPNVRFLGEKPHSELPGYSQNWTVSLIPFRDNPQIRACNPLKLREYLAAGTPIVSTDFPALEGYRDLVKVAKDAKEFAAAIRDSAHCNSETYREKCRERTARESWDKRAEEAERILGET